MKILKFKLIYSLAHLPEGAAEAGLQHLALPDPSQIYKKDFEFDE